MFEKIKKLLVDELQVSGDITEDSALAELGVNSLELADRRRPCSLPREQAEVSPSALCGPTEN